MVKIVSEMTGTNSLVARGRERTRTAVVSVRTCSSFNKDDFEKDGNVTRFKICILHGLSFFFNSNSKRVLSLLSPYYLIVRPNQVCFERHLEVDLNLNKSKSKGSAQSF